MGTVPNPLAECPFGAHRTGCLRHGNGDVPTCLRGGTLAERVRWGKGKGGCGGVGLWGERGVKPRPGLGSGKWGVRPPTAPNGRWWQPRAAAASHSPATSGVSQDVWDLRGQPWAAVLFSVLIAAAADYSCNQTALFRRSGWDGVHFYFFLVEDHHLRPALVPKARPMGGLGVERGQELKQSKKNAFGLTFFVDGRRPKDAGISLCLTLTRLRQKWPFSRIFH